MKDYVCISRMENSRKKHNPCVLYHWKNENGHYWTSYSWSPSVFMTLEDALETSRANSLEKVKYVVRVRTTN